MGTNPYTNPTYKPPIGAYQWVPNVTPTGNGTVFGYDSLEVVRGNFFNATTVPGGNVSTAFTGTLISPQGSQDWPVLAAFRPLTDPAHAIGATPSSPFVVTGADFSWTFKINNPAGNASCFVLNYSLAIDLTDPDFQVILTKDDSAQVKIYLDALQKGQPPPVITIDWTQYKLCNVLINGVDAKQTLSLTDYYSSTRKNPASTVVTLSFGTGKITAGYTKSISSLQIINTFKLKTLQLSLTKVMFFYAQRVNIPDQQLPAALLQYVYYVNFNYDPVQGTLYWPPSPTPTEPNLHIKMFHPDAPVNSPGMAHSLTLRFLIFSSPVYGISPADYTNIAGALGATSTSLYEAVFVGPIIGRRSVRYSATMNQIESGSSKRRVVPIDNVIIPTAIDKIILQKAVGANGASPPTADANWIKLEDYSPASPPDFKSDGAWVSPYLYLDADAFKDDWYRIIQVLQNGAQIIELPFNNQPYAENTAFTMLDALNPTKSESPVTISRRILYGDTFAQTNPLNAVNPVAMFVGDGDHYLPSSISFSAGAWTVSFSANTSDDSGSTTSYIYARFWFIPTDSAIDINNPHQYRDTTEVYFDSASVSGQTILKKGKPTTLDQVIISPPLPSKLSYIELTRYIDSFSGSSLTLPFSNGSRLVVGLYEVSVNTDNGNQQGLNSKSYNTPHFSLQIDSAYASVQTSITQPISHSIYPRHASRFSSSNYTPVSPFILTSNVVGGNKLTQDKAGFYTYYDQFTSNTSADATSTTALNGLAILETTSTSGVTPGTLALPYYKVALSNDHSSAYYVDFATNTFSFGMGKVENGDWNIDVAFDTDLDTTKIKCSFKIEGMLITTNGIVVERVFNSGFINGKDSGTLHYDAKIQFPFMISQGNTQFILRLWYYPYSVSGKAVDLVAIKTSIAPKQVALRINSLNITSHTLNIIAIGQSSSAAGSLAFYEDLPLAPNQTMDSQDFNYIADSSNEVTAFIFSDIGGLDNTGGWAISGTLNSPTWFVSYPKDMQVTVLDAGLNQRNPNNLYLRTVLGEEAKGSTELSVSSAEHRDTGIVHVVHDTPNVQVSSQSTNSSDRIIRHYRQNAIYDNADNYFVSGNNQSIVTNLNGRNPALFFVDGNKSGKNGSTLAMITQNIGSSEAETQFIASLNTSSGNEGTWIGPNRDMGDTNFTQARVLAQGLNNPSFVASKTNSLVYVAGWLAPGAIAYKEVNLYNAGRDGQTAGGKTYVVDGVKPGLTNEVDVYVSEKTISNVAATKTFPGIAIDESERIIIAYVLDGLDGFLLAKTTSGGMDFSPSYVIASMRGTAGASSDISIYAPALAFHTSTKTLYTAFWCGGKIFVTHVSGFGSQYGPILKPVQLACGNINFNDQTNAANVYFNFLQQDGSLRVDRQDNLEADVPRQRVGFFVSEKYPTQGSMIIHYFDSKNQLLMRRVDHNGVAGSPLSMSQ